MPKITVYFEKLEPEIEYKIIGKEKIIAEGRLKNTDRIVAEVPEGAFVKYVTYWTKYTKWKTEWMQFPVTEDLEYGAKPPKVAAPVAPAAPPVSLADLKMFYEAQGYAPGEAYLIALWSYENKASPGFWQIQDILRLGGEKVPASPPVPITLKQQWEDFFRNPDVITAIGLTPSSVQESFSLVFSRYSIINEREQEPEAGDYISVGLIIGGLSLAAATAIYAIMPGAAALADLSYIEPGLTGAKLGAMGIKGFLAALKGSIVKNPLLALLLIAQADVVFWAPSVLRAPIETCVSQATGYKITLETAIKNKEWTVARTALSNLEKEYQTMEDELASFPAQFFSAVGVQYTDFRTALETGKKAVEAYKTAYPQLSTLPRTYPKEWTGEDARVLDGDTIHVTGYPDIRIIGIDAHEAETDAGKEETAYLKDMIEGRRVRILMHEFGDPEKTIDMYGRLLAGVFLGDQDIALAMLEHFGSAILTKPSYQEKYRWIDWDLYKRTAAAAEGPAVKEFKISIDSEPSNAKLFIDDVYTHHLTPSGETELKDVMHLLTPGVHTFKVTKGGMEGAKRLNVTEGVNPAVKIRLETRGLKPVEPEEAPAEAVEPAPEPVEPFKINILSTPSNAKVYIDGIYTHHLTPTDEKELDDVLELIQPGKHVIRAEKAGKMGEKMVDVKAGANEPVFLTLGVVGLPETKESLEQQLAILKAQVSMLEGKLEKL